MAQSIETILLLIYDLPDFDLRRLNTRLPYVNKAKDQSCGR